MWNEMDVLPVKILERCNEGRECIHLVFAVGIFKLPHGNRDSYVFERHGEFETELRYIRKGSVVKIGIVNHKIVHLGV